jgi:hypothetical protein
VSYARRTDRNHVPVIETLRKCGWWCLDTSRIPGFVDVIAIRRSRVCFCEIKDGRKSASQRKLTKDQVLLHEDFRAAGAEVVVLMSEQQARDL